MSVAALIWLAARTTGISPTCRAVMEQYDDAREEHLEAWPFAKDIGKKIGRSLRAVKYARQQAIQAGLLRYVIGGYSAAIRPAMRSW